MCESKRITLGEIFKDIREQLELGGYINWEDWYDLEIGFADGPDSEMSCLSIYLSKDRKILWFDVEEKYELDPGEE